MLNLVNDVLEDYIAFLCRLRNLMFIGPCIVVIVEE